MVYGSGLENRRGGNFAVGSNPTLSANKKALEPIGSRAFHYLRFRDLLGSG